MNDNAKYRNRNYVDPEQRRGYILEAAIELARQDGYLNIRKEGIAARCGIGAGTVHSAYGSMADIRNDVVRVAIERGIISILADALAQKHPLARNAPDHLKAQAVASLV